MENYIALLLFVVPGFIAFKINEALNDEEDIKNSFEITVRALTYNVYILLFNYLIIYLFGYGYIINYTAMKALVSSDVRLIIAYIIMTTISSYIIGMLWHYGKIFLLIIINLHRKSSGENPITFKSSAWSQCFCGEEPKYVEIIQNGETIAKGSIHVQKAKDREIYVVMQEEFAKMQEEGCFKKKGTYFDFKNNIIIHEYD